MFEEDTTPLWGGPRLYLRAGDTLSLLWGTTRLMKEAQLWGSPHSVWRKQCHSKESTQHRLV